MKNNMKNSMKNNMKNNMNNNFKYLHYAIIGVSIGNCVVLVFSLVSSILKSSVFLPK